MLEFEQLVDVIMNWIRSVRDNNKEKLMIEFIKEESLLLRYDIESKNYLAEIIVEPEGFHPHRYVWFQALDKNKDASQKPLFYMDEHDSSLNDILNNLNKLINLIIK